MKFTYAYKYSDVTDLEKYDIVELSINGERPGCENDLIGLDYTPEKISGNRFIIIDGDNVTLNPNMADILKAEQGAEFAARDYPVLVQMKERNFKEKVAEALNIKL